MEWLSKAFNYELFGGLRVSTVVYIFLEVFLGLLFKKLVDAFMSRLARLAAKSKNVFDDILVKSVSRPAGWACVVIGVYVALKIAPLPTDPIDFQRFADGLVKAAFMLLLLWVGTGIFDGLIAVWKEKAAQTETKLDDQMIPIVHRSGKITIIILGIVLILQNLGYSVGSLLAGIGLGGAALALASKDTVANFFGSIVIFVDRPFQIGDWIEVNGVEGTVEEVGLRTTRIRTFANSLVTMPNAMFTNSVINNWSRMRKRRIKMTIGLTYSTTADQMEQAVQRVREIILNDPKIHHDFFLVYFDNFGAFSLDIFIYCFTVTTDWAEYLAAKQDLMLKIMRAIDELGLEFAFPTQTIHVESLPGEPEAMKSERPV